MPCVRLAASRANLALYHVSKLSARFRHTSRMVRLDATSLVDVLPLSLRFPLGYLLTLVLHPLAAAAAPPLPFLDAKEPHLAGGTYFLCGKGVAVGAPEVGA